MSTTIHCCLDVRGAIRRPAYWRKALRIDGRILSTDEFRDFLCDRLAEGMTAIPLGCPSPKPDGTCPGHRSENVSPTGSPKP